MFRGPFVAMAVAAALSLSAAAQVPQPFPRPGTPPPQTPPPSAPPVVTESPQPTASGDPTEATLGFPIYPAAQFLASYDAGRGQRYYLFGATVPYAEMVAYYRSVLDTRGDEVFNAPPTHMFQVGRFRDETMAFPPGVTVKDWTWGSQGYPNPIPGAEPARFPTVIMIVPAPPAAQ